MLFPVLVDSEGQQTWSAPSAGCDLTFRARSAAGHDSPSTGAFSVNEKGDKINTAIGYKWHKRLYAQND